MSKTLYKYFPLFDHLYIYQLFEYKYWDFFIWFLKNPLKRNLQKKHNLTLTGKVNALILLTLFWDFTFAVLIYDFLFKGFFALLIPAVLLLLFQLTPLPILLASIILYPADYHLKKKIIQNAKNKLKNLKHLKVVAITGSYGKTSTKDILYTLLWKKFKVVKTPKSFNTQMGVAQTILEDIKDNTDILIAEIGAYKKGEIKNIAELIKPSIGIITSIGPQHLNRFGSLENIAKAKFELVETLPKDGLAILNGEDPNLQSLALHLEGVSVKFYGQKENSYRISNIKTKIQGTTFTLVTPKEQIDISIPLIGEHHARNFLATATCAMQLGLTLKEIKERAKLLLPTPHRMEIKKIGNVTLIDNSYNTNPQSAKSSLALLNSFKGFRKVVITPGFVELGKQADIENREFGKSIGRVADKVIIVGENAKEDLLKGLKDSGFKKENIYFAKSTKEALILVQTLAQNSPMVALLENDLPDQYF